jgi:predicted nuclease of predicted toxin-antitoxin system
MRFLLNMNVSREVGKAIAELGGEFIHARDANLATADDRVVIQVARREDRVIVTHDLDYGDLLMLSGEPHVSVIIFRLRRSAPLVMCKRLREAWETIQTPLAEGAIVVIEDASMRIRPFGGESPR